MTYMHDWVREVDIFIAQRQDFALPHAGRESDHQDWLKPVTTSGCQELLRLVFRENAMFFTLSNGRVHDITDVTPDQIPLDGLLKRPVQNRVNASYGGRCEALLRSEEHTSELQLPDHLVCRLLLEKKQTINT